ncbi:MAG: hypothetical protein LBV11_08030 [Bacillus cereus]|jgi:hypothetical protein|nr:hypothetical protein [Bacillus cereus]
MGITNEELFELIDQLDEKEKESLYKFLRPWSKRKQPTINPSPAEYVQWEELLKECKKDEVKD